MKLHVGCGRNLFQGWVNLDYGKCPVENGPPYIQHDLRQSIPLPNNSCALIYSEHLIEHLTLDEGKTLLREFMRLLKPGGTVRISTPDLRTLFDAYLDKNVNRYANVGFLPKTPCQMVNEGMRSWEHKFLYDKQELADVLQDAGFVHVRARAYRISAIADLRDLETRPYNGEIIMEADRPN